MQLVKNITNAFAFDRLRGLTCPNVFSKSLSFSKSKNGEWYGQGTLVATCKLAMPDSAEGLRENLALWEMMGLRYVTEPRARKWFVTCQRQIVIIVLKLRLELVQYQSNIAVVLGLENGRNTVLSMVLHRFWSCPLSIVGIFDRGKATSNNSSIIQVMNYCATEVKILQSYGSLLSVRNYWFWDYISYLLFGESENAEQTNKFY